MRFSHQHVRAMIREHPHLSMFVREFEASPACSNLVRDYIAEEGRKYQQIYAAYLHTLRQIDDMVRTNGVILAQNAKLKKKRALIEIPVRPIRSSHRFFRDLDVLKTMLRGWFELEYKKWQRKAALHKR